MKNKENTMKSFAAELEHFSRPRDEINLVCYEIKKNKNK